MSRIYTSTNKIKFTEITDKYKVNKASKGKISQLHSKLITFVVGDFKNTRKYKQQVVDALNLITYSIYADEMIPFYWSAAKPFENFPEIDPDLIENTIEDVYLTVDSIIWDVKPVDSGDNSLASESISRNTSSDAVQSAKSVEGIRTSHSATQNLTASQSSKPKVSQEIIINPTPKQDLYIQPPVFPQFDYTKPWMQGTQGADKLVIYTSLPEIPTKQNEISVTTDVTKMTSKELMNLYPNHTIHTRSSSMYEECEGIEIDPDLGLILPIEGYTKEQIIDNMIKYPHIFKPLRYLEGRWESFYLNIEIDGQLYSTLDVWDSLPESSIIPRQSSFVKEYVARRYLLERDIKKVTHKYPMYGELTPYLTLFMTPTSYIERGYKDVEELAKKCVLSRVLYKQSRNPVIRRLSENV